MMRSVNSEILASGSGGRLAGNRNLLRRDAPLLGAVFVVDPIVFLDDRFQIFVDIVDAARCVHPAGPLVESLVDEELAPGRRAVGIQAFVARHLQFGAEEERGVWVDEKKRVMADR